MNIQGAPVTSAGATGQAKDAEDFLLCPAEIYNDLKMFVLDLIGELDSRFHGNDFRLLMTKFKGLDKQERW